ncbi:hypothetical protein [Larkinella terrae]|uniref:Uncharacterized protein n=1 Tax=Larkinella terrae TaxID=2025311 RepID=A0A7K0EIN9_9BACT|nr:hypothetical protein [Larkinella terrae]MRS61654.1 hypothetical protein [Larkinella terrae]
MTILFDKLFTQTVNGFVCRESVRITVIGVLLQKGDTTDALEAGGINIYQWVGKKLSVSLTAGIHTITGLPD